MCELSVVLAEDALADVAAQLQNVTAEKPLAVGSFLKAANKRGDADPRLGGPNLALSFADAMSYEEHLELSREPPFPMEHGHHVLPSNVQAVLRIITERVSGVIKVPRGKFSSPRFKPGPISFSPNYEKMEKQWALSTKRREPRCTCLCSRGTSRKMIL